MAAATKLVLSLLFFQLTTTAYSIGVNYGTLADNLPPPAQVANFIKTQTIIDSVKIFDVNPDIIKAFANTGISLTITIPNGEIPGLTSLDGARRYIDQHIKPFHPATKFKYILMGNEILHWGDAAQKNGLVPAMRMLYAALVQAGMRDIKVSTPHSLGIMLSSEPASAGRFRPEVIPILLDQLKFCRETKSPFIFNPYPYFGWSPEKENFALFRPNKGILDQYTKKMYTNMFDNLMDAVYSACKALGFTDVEFVAAETGWPSACEYPVCSVQNAVDYNGNLIKHVNSGKGTPLMPNRKFETYIFALFNENQKPGPSAEKNWGLFRPDFSPVYNAGVLRNQQGGALPGTTGPAQPVNPVKPGKGGKPATPAAAGGKKWCVAKPGASAPALQANIDYVCGKGVDCKPVQPGGVCASEGIVGKASYLMNAFYQANGRNNFNCDFSGSGLITNVNPSHGACVYNA
ncbi:glucan endo-1,3-beta-glucosidase-like [Argentina anserina]|uniref:glucan endo-1,3-beta-glucosidase-like n=1 Tax=Argentina anserina TaxID=57926 RepID=UPI0021763123|nr:glucan endo-1,3-beta-glucosidase-like [Potentilla anserina]